MNDAEIQERVIPHLSGRLERADPILFTGAGFSIGAKNIRGDSPPMAPALKRELWSLCFPGEPFDQNASLADLYHAALARHRGDLATLLTRLYTAPLTFPWVESTSGANVR